MDHAEINERDISFGDDFDVFMTEKDAVKIARQSADKFWSVPVELKMDDNDSKQLLDRIESRLQARVDD